MKGRTSPQFGDHSPTFQRRSYFQLASCRTSPINTRCSYTMPPSNSLKNTAKSLKTLQSKVYFSIEIIISCHKTNRITYHEMLDHLSRCESEIKIATDPARLQSLQGLKVHIKAIMQGLEDDMGRTMQTVQCMRVTSKFHSVLRANFSGMTVAES